MGRKLAIFAGLVVVLMLVWGVLPVVMVAGAPARLGPGASCDQALPFVGGSTSGELDESGALWYRYDAKETFTVGFGIRLPVSDFSPIVTVFGSCGGSVIAQVAGAVGDLTARVDVAVTAGQSYFIRISKQDPSSGDSFTFGGTGPEGNGCPGTGDCFEANGTPGCDDTCEGAPGPPPPAPCPGCCDTVCTLDTFCCDTAWDSICAGEAMTNCVVVPVELEEFKAGERA